MANLKIDDLSAAGGGVVDAMQFETDTGGTTANKVTATQIKTYVLAGQSTDAPTGAQYVTLANDGTLSAERVLTAGSGISITDGGANNPVTAAVSISAITEETVNPEIAADKYLFYDNSATANKIAKFPVIDPDFNVKRYFTAKTDFAGFSGASNNTVGAGDFIMQASGTASVTTALATTSATRVGIVDLQCGTTTTGSSIIALSGSSMRFGGGTWVWEADVQIPIVSDGTNSFTVCAGFSDTNAADAVDGIYFRYTHSASSGNWECVTSNNSTRTTTNSTIAMTAAQWYNLRIEVNAAGSSVDFIINGTVRATTTTNIPTSAGRETGQRTLIIKSLGTTSRSAYVDYILVYAEFSSNRT